MLKSRLFLVTYLKILSSRRAITKTVALVLIIVAFVAALVPIDLYYSLLSQDLANKDSTPSPTPSSTISLTPTPSTPTTPTATPHPTQIPTYQPDSTPYPPATPTPTYPPLGTGPSTTETLVNESPATVQNLLSDLSSDQKSTFSTES